MTKEEAKELQRIMLDHSLMDCFKAYSNQNNHKLRIALEVIQYLMGYENSFIALKERERLLEEFKEQYPGLATKEVLHEVEGAIYDYFEMLKAENIGLEEI